MLKHNFYYTRLIVLVAVPLFFWGQSEMGHAQDLLAQGGVSTAREIVLDMESYVFTPSEVTVAFGEPLRLILRNQSFLVPHNFLLDDPHGVRVLEADISSGESQTHLLTLTEAGVYLFYCQKQLLFFPTHREKGMEGRFIVQ